MYSANLPITIDLFNKKSFHEVFFEERTQEFFAGFPHVSKKLKAFWGEKEFRPYISSLINDSSRPNRRGFPSNCMLILFRMLEIHDKEFPHFQEKNNLWDELI